MINMTKKQAEKQLNRALTDAEFCKYMHDLNFKNNKKQVRTQKTTVKKDLKFNDAKNDFLETLTKENDKKYYSKSYEYALKFDDNFLLFQKSDIKTYFCFGYGQNGVSTQDDFERATGMRDYASENEKYFINENLKALNENIETMKAMLQAKKDDYCEKMYKKTNAWHFMDLQRVQKIYLCKNNNNTCYLFEFTGSFDNENRLKYCNVLKELAKEDFLNILAVYEQQKENFTKRLQTYLKRYGLEKLHTWTYLVD